MLMRTVLTIALTLLVTVLAACGGGDDAATDGPFSGTTSNDSEDFAEAVQDEEDAPAMDADRDEAGSGYAGQLTEARIDRRVIRSGELELYVTDVNGSVRHARDLASDAGGYVDASSTRMLNHEREIANLTLEVPSSEFDGTLDALRNGPYVDRVEHESTDSRDVTEEYVDLQSRLANLEATETRFVTLLDEAESIDQILNVEREISRIRGEIEQIKGRINYLEQRTDYSRIHVAFHPVEETVQIAGQHFTPGETARDAWNASMEFIGAIGNAAIAVAVFLWWAWPFAIGALVLVIRYRRQREATAAGTTT